MTHVLRTNLRHVDDLENSQKNSSVLEDIQKLESKFGKKLPITKRRVKRHD